MQHKGISRTAASVPGTSIASRFPGSARPTVLIVQRVVPSYREELFERLKAERSIDYVLASGAVPCSEAIVGTNRPGLVDYTLSNHKLPWLGGVTLVGNLLECLRKTSPQVVIVEANPRLSSSYQIALWCRVVKRPMILWGLGKVDRKRSLLFDRVSELASSWLANHGTAAIGYSTAAAEFYIERGFDRSRVVVAPNATRPIPSIEDTAVSAADAAWAAAEGIKTGVPSVLYVGRLTSVKRLDILFQASGEVSAPHQILVVGDGPERTALEEQARANPWPVYFFGHQDSFIVERCLRLAAVFVLPGRGGLALHQAMSFGVPTLVSEADGSERALVEDGVSGYYFEPGNAGELALVLSRCLMDPVGSERLGAEGRERVIVAGGLDEMIRSFNDAVMIALE